MDLIAEYMLAIATRPLFLTLIFFIFCSDHKNFCHKREICDICHKVQYNFYYLRRHRAEAHGIIAEGMVQCDFCPLVFTHKSQMKEHILSKHAEGDQRAVQEYVQTVVKPASPRKSARFAARNKTDQEELEEAICKMEFEYNL